MYYSEDVVSLFLFPRVRLKLEMRKKTQHFHSQNEEDKRRRNKKTNIQMCSVFAEEKTSLLHEIEMYYTLQPKISSRENRAKHKNENRFYDTVWRKKGFDQI